MTQQEIQERNKQILLMMGYHEATLEEKLKWCGIPTEERLNRINQSDVPAFFNEKEEPLFIESICCDSDWRWLMKAVEIIRLKKYSYDMYCPSYITDTDSDSEFECNLWDGINSEICGRSKSSLKEAIFMVVSDFAKLYNNKEL
jgi:hypothetical protein